MSADLAFHPIRQLIGLGPMSEPMFAPLIFFQGGSEAAESCRALNIRYSRWSSYCNVQPLQFVSPWESDDNVDPRDPDLFHSILVLMSS